MSDQSNDQAEKTRPVKTHSDGRLTAAIWANDGSDPEKGKIYNTTLNYSYPDKDGNWRDTTSIPSHELLKAGRLLEQSYGSVRQLKDRERAEYVAKQQEQAQTKGQDREHGPSR